MTTIDIVNGTHLDPSHFYCSTIKIVVWNPEAISRGKVVIPCIHCEENNVSCEFNGYVRYPRRAYDIYEEVIVFQCN